MRFTRSRCILISSDSYCFETTNVYPLFGRMNAKDFLRLGVPLGEATRRATDFVSKFVLGGGDKSRLHEEVAAIIANPNAFLNDALRKGFAQALLNAPPPPRAEPVKYRQWGEGLEHD